MVAGRAAVLVVFGIAQTFYVSCYDGDHHAREGRSMRGNRYGPEMGAQNVERCRTRRMGFRGGDNPATRSVFERVSRAAIFISAIGRQ